MRISGVVPNLAQARVQLSRRNARGVGRFYQSPTPFFEGLQNPMTCFGLNTRFPVVAVDDVVGFELFEVGNVVECLLGNDLCDAFDLLDDGFSLFVAQEWQPFVPGNRFIGKKAYRHFSQVSSHLDDVHMAGVDQVGAHGDVYLWHLHFSKISLMMRAPTSALRPKL